MRIVGWHYETSVGSFKILPSRHGVPGGWDLWFDTETVGFYSSPESAADSVATHTSGAHDWDLQDPDPEDPTGLDAWTPISAIALK